MWRFMEVDYTLFILVCAVMSARKSVIRRSICQPEFDFKGTDTVDKIKLFGTL